MNYFDDCERQANDYSNPTGATQDETGQWWTEDGIPMISNRDRYYKAGTAALQGKR